MAQDPSLSYTINTSSLPVYVLPPDQYNQQFGQAGTPVDFQQQVVYTQQPQWAPAPVGYPGQPVHMQTFPPQQPPSFAYATQQATQVPSNSRDQLVASLLSRDHLPGMCNTINEAFRLFGTHCGYYLLWFLCFVVFVTGYACLEVFLPLGGVWASIRIIAYFLFIFILIPLISGFLYATIQVSRIEGTPMQPSFFFTTFRPSFVLTVILLHLVSGLIVGLGFLLLIVPGVYFLVCFSFSHWIFLEYEKHGITWYQALSISKSVVSKNWCFWFGYSLLLALMSIVPLMTPIVMIAWTIAFRDTFGLIEQHDTSQFALSTNL